MASDVPLLATGQSKRPKARKVLVTFEHGPKPLRITLRKEMTVAALWPLVSRARDGVDAASYILTGGATVLLPDDGVLASSPGRDGDVVLRCRRKIEQQDDMIAESRASRLGPEAYVEAMRIEIAREPALHATWAAMHEAMMAKAEPPPPRARDMTSRAARTAGASASSSTAARAADDGDAAPDPEVADCADRGVGQMIFVPRAGAKLRPHCGPTNARLTVHMGLIVPPGGSRITVGGERASGARASASSREFYAARVAEGRAFDGYDDARYAAGRPRALRGAAHRRALQRLLPREFHAALTVTLADGVTDAALDCFGSYVSAGGAATIAGAPRRRGHLDDQLAGNGPGTTARAHGRGPRAQGEPARVLSLWSNDISDAGAIKLAARSP
ncbi:peptide-aspartate beta-dioxygenase [Aureococcus anophagefferens]|nr:peptide-aspartate beta-dioxygenase [Aureococcus anophagefferens]